MIASHRDLGERWLACAGAPASALHRERDQPRAAVRSAEPHAVREGRIPSPAHRRRRDGGQPRRQRHQGRGALSRSTVPRGGSATVRVRLADTALGTEAVQPAAFDAIVKQRRDEADAFYAAITARQPERRRATGGAPGARRHAVEQAALLLRSRRVARRPRRAARCRTSESARAATRSGSTW